MSKSKKLPALQFYPGDWRKDPGVQSLDYFERGVWLEILLMMHESEERGVLLLNGKPMSIDRLSTLLGLVNQKTTTVVNSLLETGVVSKREDGALFSRRMVRDEKVRSVRIEAGKRGGNPNLVKQKSTTQVKQKSTPSSSSSSSSSSSINKKSKPKKVFGDFKHVHLTEAQEHKYRNEYGEAFFKRLVEKLDSWIEQDPTPKRIKNGKNADATFRAWVLNAVMKEQMEAQKGNGKPRANGFFQQKQREMDSLREELLEDLQSGSGA